MTTKEIAQYWATLDQSYLSRYDRLAEGLACLIQSDSYDQEIIMALEDLIDLAKEKSAQTKSLDAWHKAMSFVYASDRA